jgi:glyoxylase-like metal-dependent hydrolase (beta-lactamase superfamily II)
MGEGVALVRRAQIAAAGSDMPSGPVTSRRSFLAGSATLAAIWAVAALTAAPSPTRRRPRPCPPTPPSPSALGPAVNDQGDFVGRVEQTLYWVTDGTYQAAFLTTGEGVVLFGAPPSIGHNLQRAIDQIAAANAVSNQVTYPIYSHHHADHIGTRVAVRPRRGAGRLGGQQAAADARQRPDPAGPDLTFDPRDTLRVGGERIRPAWRGTNHTSDNIYIHCPARTRSCSSTSCCPAGCRSPTST